MIDREVKIDNEFFRFTQLFDWKVKKGQLLLNTYFNQISLPLVEILQDIRLKKQISIASSLVVFIDFSLKIDESIGLKKDILARIIEFEKFQLF